MAPRFPALRATLPVMFGYIPLGIAFGILFQGLGYAWHLSSLMGLLVFAGAAQFMAIGLLAIAITSLQSGLPVPIASTLTLGVHRWLRHPLISIFSGTACYMLLIQSRQLAPA